MKLSWSTTNGRLYEATFLHLTLQVDFDAEAYGIREGENSIWGHDMHCDTAWEDWAEECEAQLKFRLLEVADSLDASFLQADKPLLCDVCGEEDVELHKGFYEGDQMRCAPCLHGFREQVITAQQAAQSGSLASIYHSYALEHQRLWEGLEKTKIEAVQKLICEGDASGFYPIDPKMQHEHKPMTFPEITDQLVKTTPPLRVISEQGPIMHSPNFTLTPVGSVDIETAKAAENIVKHYWHEIPLGPQFYHRIKWNGETAPSTQVADAIKAEAATVKL